MKDLEKQVIEVMAGGEEQDPLILGRINMVSIAQHCYLRKKTLSCFLPCQYATYRMIDQHV
jgi:hypothetical protein